MKIIKTLLPIILLIFSCTTAATNKIKQSQPNKSQPTVAKKSSTDQRLDVWLAEINTNLYQDVDRDGYYQNFELTFDLDTRFSRQDVFVEVWIEGSTFNQQRIFTSNVITLSGDSSLDSQQINIQLIDDYPTDYYQLELVIIDAHSRSVIFTIDQYHSNQLQNLALESQRYDQHHDLSIYAAQLDLSRDNNHNGYYQQLDVSFDIDSPNTSSELIAEFYLDDLLLFTSESFWIHGNNTSDKQFFTIKLRQGIATGYYDLDIHLIDAKSHQRRHQIAALDWIVFQDLPLESQQRDNNNGAHQEIEINVEQHGGSIGWMLISLLALLMLRRSFAA